MNEEIDQLLVDYLLANARIGSLDVICGVYFLFDGDEMVYIGQSRDILLRLRVHEADATKPFDRWAYVDVPEKDLMDVEARYIRMFQPPYNRTHQVFPRRRHIRPSKTLGKVVATARGLRLIDDQPLDWSQQVNATETIAKIMQGDR